MDKTIITALLIIAGVVGAVLTFNAVYPAVVQSSDAMAGRQRRIDERLKSQIEIIHATGNDSSSAYVWVKNIGYLTIGAIERWDVSFGHAGNSSRISHEDDAGWIDTLVELRSGSGYRMEAFDDAAHHDHIGRI